jgi:hypothetical protein
LRRGRLRSRRPRRRRPAGPVAPERRHDDHAQGARQRACQERREDLRSTPAAATGGRNGLGHVLCSMSVA